MGSEGPVPAGGGSGVPGGPRPPGSGAPEGAPLSVRSLERKILLAAGALLGGIALWGRWEMLPGAAVGAAVAWVNFFLIRKILEKAFGGGTVGKGFAVQYVLKFLALVAVVYLVVRSGRFDVAGFLIGLSALFLGVAAEAAVRSFR